MKVEKLVESVFLMVNGGKPSTDDNVMRADITALVPDAVNEVMALFYAADVPSSEGTEPNPVFLQVFEAVAIALSATRKKFTFTLPKTPLSVNVFKSVRSVGLMDGTLFTHFYPQDGTLGSYNIQIDRAIPAYSVEGTSVVLYNVPTGTAEVLVKQLVHIDDYALTDEIIVPSGTENALISKLFAMFMQQKSIQPDNLINGATT